MNWNAATSNMTAAMKKLFISTSKNMMVNKHHRTAVFQVIVPDLTVKISFDCRLVVSSTRTVLWLCLAASRELARGEALFNKADAKVPPIQ